MHYARRESMETAESSGPSHMAAKKERIRPQWRTWLKRVALWLLIIVVVAAVLGVIFQAVATANDRRNYPPPGQMVEIGTPGTPYQLHLYCQGSGSPTVILESGQGGLSSDWAWIQPAVAQSTRVCAYDRAGVAWSDPGPSPRDARQIVQELHTLLVKAELPAPYLLVGHSYGGLYARVYAGSYPDEVSGIVLVDASHPEQWQRLPGAQQQFQRLQWTYRVAQVLYRLGILRLINYNTVNPALPPQQGPEHKAMADTTRFVDTVALEFNASAATSVQVLAAGTLVDMPLFVLSASEHGTPPETEQIWQELQLELATLSTNSVHQIVQGADHISLLIEEEDAQVTTAAILAVIEAIRTGQPLRAE
jgi:pimeloyl-ACP methyl ester carboxylesterase